MSRKHHHTGSISKAELRRRRQPVNNLDITAEFRGHPAIQKDQRDHRQDSAVSVSGINQESSKLQGSTTTEKSSKLSPGNYLHNLACIPGEEPAPLPRTDRLSLGDLVVFFIAFMTVLGVAYAFAEFVLTSTSAHASCVPSTSTSTVYIPVTQTQTVTSISTAFPSSIAAAGVAASSSSSISYQTITTITSVSTNTVTVTPTLTELTVASSSETSYLYYVTSGSTIWQDGISPSSCVVLTYATASVFVTPQPALTDTTVTVHSTSTITQLTTITMPPYTSTVFSLMSPESTTMLYSTHYLTVESSRVSSHSSFTGINSGGWNTTSTAPGVTATPEVTTLTQIVYHGNGNSTTSTLTTRITATVGDVITQTFTPSSLVTAGAVSAGTAVSVSTVTLEPSTVTFTVGNALSSQSTGTGSPAGSAPVSAATPSALTTSRAVSRLPITTTIALSPTAITLLASSSQSLSAYTPPVNNAGSETTTYPTTLTTSSSVTFFTLTSFISGHGTTFTLTSLPAATNPQITVVNGTTSVLPIPSSTTSSFSRGNGLPQTSAGSITSQPQGSALSAAAVTGSSQTVSVSASTSSQSVTSQSTSVTSRPSSSHTMLSSNTHSSISSTSSRNSSDASTLRPTRTSSLAVTPKPAAPTQSCGEQGDFIMDFDDLPSFHSGSARRLSRQANSWNSTGNGTDVTQQPPLSMRPYKHMLFSSGYVYSPQPVEPFAPASPPNVAVFLANGTGLKTGQKPFDLEPGEIADGPTHEGDPTFFFHSYSAAIGCDNAGPGACTMEVTSYVWDHKTRDDIPSHAQNYTIPPCTGFRNCHLTNVTFPRSFRNLSGLQIRAVKDNEPRMFFVDNIHNRWADSSCTAGSKRARSP